MTESTINRFNDITLYELMSEDMDVWVTINKHSGINLQIDDENGRTIVDEKGVHPYAAESLAIFCRSYLRFYDKAANTVDNP